MAHDMKSDPWASLRPHRVIASLILLTTGVAKFVGVVLFRSDDPTFDPIFMLPTHWLMMLVGSLELGTAIHCLLNRNPGLSHQLIAWLGGCFLLYRGALIIVGANIRCPCLGSIISQLPVSGAWVDIFLWTTIVVLLAGGFAPLVSRKGTSLKQAAIQGD